jgi:hypothetical protein
MNGRSRRNLEIEMENHHLTSKNKLTRTVRTYSDMYRISGQIDIGLLKSMGFASDKAGGYRSDDKLLHFKYAKGG